jgi:hypothetical protein
VRDDARMCCTYEIETTVLLVEADPEERERLGSWLEDAGYGVMTCSGPIGPDYACVGDRTNACPLAAAASVVVLDMNTESEAVVMGTASEDLLGMYLFEGRRVVTLGSHRNDEIPGQLLHLRRYPERDDLVEAVRSLGIAREASIRSNERFCL